MVSRSFTIQEIGKDMGWVRNSAYALFFAISLIISLAVPSGVAIAASDYDGTITTADELHIASPSYGCSAKNLTLSWSGIMLNSSGYSSVWGQYLGGADSSAISTDFSTTLDNGTGWTVSQGNFNTGSSNGGGGAIFDNTVNIQFSPSETAYVDFGTIGAHTYAYMRTTDNGYVYNVRLSYYKPTGGPDAGKCLPVVNQTARWTGDKDINWINNNLGGQNFSIATDWHSGDNGFVTTARPLFANADVHYPQIGYEGVLIPSEYIPPTYVAMGDSFSSGEGVEPFEDGTDVEPNTCHRSVAAWPIKLADDSALNLTNFVACSGAVSDYIINEYNQETVEPAQAMYVSDSTQLITISIGGNDVGFGNVLATCTVETDQEGTAEEKHQIEHDACIEAIGDARGTATSAALQSKLQAVFSGLRSLGNQNLQVVVVGYPNLLPAYGDIVGTCVWGDGNLTTSGRNVASDEVEKSRLLHDELNGTIENAVNATSDSRVHFVDPSTAFAGHELCRPDPWFNNVVPSVDPIMRHMSYHPNGSGQTAYAGAVGIKVGSLFP